VVYSAHSGERRGRRNSCTATLRAPTMGNWPIRPLDPPPNRQDRESIVPHPKFFRSSYGEPGCTFSYRTLWNIDPIRLAVCGYHDLFAICCHGELSI
jgi:hypothetical protein